MKNLVDTLFEAKRTSAGFSKFNKYQLKAIEDAFSAREGAKISFKLDDNHSSFSKISGKIIPGRYPKLELKYEDKQYGSRTCTGQFFICDRYIGAAPALDKLTISDYECKVIDFSYDESEDITTLSFRVDHGFKVDSWKYLYGDVTFKLKGNCVNPVVEKLDFDGKKFVKYMKEYLPKKEDYLRSFDWDEEILDCYAEYRKSKKELYIKLYLECGKGYSVHHRTEEYRFEHDGTQYCSIDGHKFYDRDHEAQIIRKFRSGVMNYIKRLSCPQYLTIHVEQELD